MSKDRKPLPRELSALLNGAAAPAPVRPVEIYELKIPTGHAGPDDKEIRRRNALAIRLGLDIDLPF